jgi:hypothetical protein
MYGPGKKVFTHLAIDNNLGPRFIGERSLQGFTLGFYYIDADPKINTERDFLKLSADEGKSFRERKIGLGFNR